jgi:excisionase family DNA binding protein
MIGGSNRLISLGELAEYLGVARSTVYKHWPEYGIPHVRLHGKYVRFRERDVALYLERLGRETANGAK